jgi:hypothetical protein
MKVKDMILKESLEQKRAADQAAIQNAHQMDGN